MLHHSPNYGSSAGSFGGDFGGSSDRSSERGFGGASGDASGSSDAAGSFGGSSGSGSSGGSGSFGGSGASGSSDAAGSFGGSSGSGGSGGSGSFGGSGASGSSGRFGRTSAGSYGRGPTRSSAAGGFGASGRYGAGSSGRSVNVSDEGRVISAVAGSLLLYFVAKRHKFESFLLLGGSYLLYRAISGHCPVSDAIKNSRHEPASGSNVNIRTHVIVNKPRSEVYAFWRRLENWPLFMRHLENVDELDNTTSAWRLKLPGMGEVRWEARIVKEEKDNELSWHSVPDAPIESTAKINFSDTPAGATRIDVMLSYRAPAGAIGERLSRLLTPAFREKVDDDIRNFKHYFENVGVSGV
ncbi:MAG TPA: SRPBCC family protein [Puia sp.]|nr:SRPBCC family protein [Puia sp.]